jgi:hypothetical protein
MTQRGMLTCDECGEMATYCYAAPIRSATSDEFWCGNHFPISKAGWDLLTINQALMILDDGSEIWYPSYLVDGEWKGWPLMISEKKSWWQFWK